MTLPVTAFLRRVLTVDALMSGATGVLLLTAAGLLAPLLDVPEALLRYAGVVLVPFVVYVWAVSRRSVVPRAALVAIIALNLAWVAASVWVAVGGAIRPNPFGYAFIFVQAVAVAAFAEFQIVGLRRAGAHSAAV